MQEGGRNKGKKIVKQRRRQNGEGNGHIQREEVEEPTLFKTKVPSAEDIRRKMAREMLEKIEPSKAIKEDDFFMADQQQNKKLQHDTLGQQLNTQFLRKQNKLYEDLSGQFKEKVYDEAVEYKGHTLCITGFQVTGEHIYSCSKDRSIIRWDRETKQKHFVSLGKEENHHTRPILALSVHYNPHIIATGGDDGHIKLWDTRSPTLIDTLMGHKNTINGLKFGTQSHNLCSVSSDLTLKQWDFGQRGLIATYYEHNAQILDIDCLNGNDFITSGYDKQVISWKTQKQTKVIYKGHQYAVDRVRCINLERFVTACQDGSVYIWNAKKTKPVFKVAQAHSKGWISALDNIKQSNIFATAGIDNRVKLWNIEGDVSGVNLLQELQIKGIATDLKLSREWLAVTECDELRLGRWVTCKARNKIKVFRAVQSP